MMDENVTRKSGIYTYVLDGDERPLNIRAFTDNNKREAFERQNGVCPKCSKTFELAEMEADQLPDAVQRRQSKKIREVKMLLGDHSSIKARETG